MKFSIGDRVLVPYENKWRAACVTGTFGGLVTFKFDDNGYINAINWTFVRPNNPSVTTEDRIRACLRKRREAQ